MLHHFKLQLAHSAQQHVAAHLGLEDLDGTFFAQLGQALLQLFGTQRVLEHHGHEHFGREEGQAGVHQVDAAIGDGVAQLHAAMGGKAHDVTRVGFFHRLAALAHEGHHAGGAQLFAVRMTLSFMPGVYLPLAMRTKAMRSRWLASILACTLNTTPLNASSSGALP